jgi:hypothetical protein
VEHESIDYRLRGMVHGAVSLCCFMMFCRLVGETCVIAGLETFICHIMTVSVLPTSGRECGSLPTLPDIFFDARLDLCAPFDSTHNQFSEIFC